jgi:hypothetical protein
MTDMYMYWEIKVPQGYDVNCRGSPGLLVSTYIHVPYYRVEMDETI